MLFACPESTKSDADAGDPLCAASVGSRPATIDVWVDGQARMLRLETKIDAGHALTIDSRVDYSRFGRAVTIAPPPKSELVGVPSPADLGIGKPTTVTGPWQTVVSGTTAGVHWSLSFAPAKNATCLDFAGTPTVAMAPTGIPTGPTVMRDGRTVPCQDQTLIAAQDVAVISSSAATSAVTAVAGLVEPGVHTLVAHLANGTTQTVAIDARTRSFAWVGPAAPKLVSLTAQSAGGEVTCTTAEHLFGAVGGQPGAKPPAGPPPDLGLGYLCLRTADLNKLAAGMQQEPVAPPPAP